MIFKNVPVKKFRRESPKGNNAINVDIEIYQFGTLPFNSVLYQSANVSPRNRVIDECESIFQYFGFSPHRFFQSPLEISDGFYIYFGNSRFRARAPRKLFSNVKRDFLRCVLQSASRLHLF